MFQCDSPPVICGPISWKSSTQESQIALWIVACLGAYPFALFMNEPRLMWMIPVAAITSVILGFTSTAVPTLNRHLALGRITFWEIGSQMAGVVFVL